MLAAALLLGWFEPFYQSDLAVGNINLLQLGMLATFIGLETGFNPEDA